MGRGCQNEVGAGNKLKRVIKRVNCDDKLRAREKQCWRFSISHLAVSIETPTTNRESLIMILPRETRQELRQSAEILRALANMIEQAEEEAALPCVFVHFLSPDGEDAISRGLARGRQLPDPEDIEQAVFQVSPSDLQKAYLDYLERAAAEYIGSTLAELNFTPMESSNESSPAPN